MHDARFDGDAEDILGFVLNLDLDLAVLYDHGFARVGHLDGEIDVAGGGMNGVAVAQAADAVFVRIDCRELDVGIATGDALQRGGAGVVGVVLTGGLLHAVVMRRAVDQIRPLQSRSDGLRHRREEDILPRRAAGAEERKALVTRQPLARPGVGRFRGGSERIAHRALLRQRGAGFGRNLHCIA